MTDAIKKPSQYDKITKLHENSEWVCGNAYRAEYIFSAHKRRGEYAKKFGVSFKTRKCEHGHRAVKDYRMIEDDPRPPYIKPCQPTSEDYLNRKLRGELT